MLIERDGERSSWKQQRTLTLAVLNRRLVSVVGPGGAGKTTFVRQMTRWLKMDNELTRQLGTRPICLFLEDGPPAVMDAIAAHIQSLLSREVDTDLLRALLRSGHL